MKMKRENYKMYPALSIENIRNHDIELYLIGHNKLGLQKDFRSIKGVHLSEEDLGECYIGDLRGSNCTVGGKVGPGLYLKHPIFTIFSPLPCLFLLPPFPYRLFPFPTCLDLVSSRSSLRFSFSLLFSSV